jgi:hypothetical protein
VIAVDALHGCVKVARTSIDFALPSAEIGAEAARTLLFLTLDAWIDIVVAVLHVAAFAGSLGAIGYVSVHNAVRHSHPFPSLEGAVAAVDVRAARATGVGVLFGGYEARDLSAAGLLVREFATDLAHTSVRRTGREFLMVGAAGAVVDRIRTEIVAVEARISVLFSQLVACRTHLVESHRHVRTGVVDRGRDSSLVSTSELDLDSDRVRATITVATSTLISLNDSGARLLEHELADSDGCGRDVAQEQLIDDLAHQLVLVVGIEVIDELVLDQIVDRDVTVGIG